MIASDEEQEYGIFALLSDVGGGLGIFLGLSFLRLVVANFKSILISHYLVYLDYAMMRLNSCSKGLNMLLITSGDFGKQCHYEGVTKAFCDY